MCWCVQIGLRNAGLNKVMQKKSYHKKFTRAFHMVMVFNLVIVRQGYTACPKFPWLCNLVFLASPNIRDPGIPVWEVRAEKSEVSGWPLPRASSCILAVAFSLRLQPPTLHFLSLTTVCLLWHSLSTNALPLSHLLPSAQLPHTRFCFPLSAGPSALLIYLSSSSFLPHPLPTPTCPTVGVAQWSSAGSVQDPPPLRTSGTKPRDCQAHRV